MDHGAFCFGGSAVAAEAMLNAGLAFVCLDAQHGRWDDASVVAALDLLQTRSAQVLVRVRQLDDGLIGRALDAGAGGVIVPLVETPAQAAKAVAAVRYPPAGRRSFGPIRAAYGELGDRTAADASTVLAVMIETAAGLDAVEDIAAIPGVDRLFVGPFDLSLSLGTDVDALLADDADKSPLRRVVAAAHAAGIRAGAYAGDPQRAVRFVELGYDWVVVTSDLAAVQDGARSALAAVASGGRSGVGR